MQVPWKNAAMPEQPELAEQPEQLELQESVGQVILRADTGAGLCGRAMRCDGMRWDAMGCDALRRLPTQLPIPLPQQFASFPANLEHRACFIDRCC